MRCLIILIFIMGVGTARVSSMPAVVQAEESDFGPPSTAEQFEGVSRPRPQIYYETPQEDPILQPYEVYFAEQYARVENLENVESPTFDAEYMVIEVKQGIFGLQVGDQGAFIVDPAGEAPIQYVELPPDPLPTGTPTTGTEPYVVPLAEYVRNAAGNICTNMCALPLNRAVFVKPGDIVIAQAYSLCLWCLLHGTQTELDEGADDGIPQIDSGLLLVSIPLAETESKDSFSWIQAWDQVEGMATPSASTRPVTMAWAFNPPSGCN